MGDFPSHQARPRFGRIRAAVVAVCVGALCLSLAGGAAAPKLRTPAVLIAGMDEIPSPPQGTSWAPQPIDAGGLSMVASADGQEFGVHTAGGLRTFLPGVDLGGTTPGHATGDMTISAAQYVCLGLILAGTVGIYLFGRTPA